jgi:hypothetical protein
MAAPERDEFFSGKLWAGAGGDVTKMEPRGKREEVISQGIGMRSKDISIRSITSRTTGGQTRARDWPEGPF